MRQNKNLLPDLIENNENNLLGYRSESELLKYWGSDYVSAAFSSSGLRSTENRLVQTE